MGRDSAARSACPCSRCLLLWLAIFGGCLSVGIAIGPLNDLAMSVVDALNYGALSLDVEAACFANGHAATVKAGFLSAGDSGIDCSPP